MSLASIDVGGIKLKYFAVGAGEPIVLLHCTAGSGRQWTDMAEALCPNFQVVAPDLCGYGDTTHWPGNGTFNLAVEADLVAALLDRFKKPAHVIGHSYAGAVAVRFALRHARYVKSLTLIEPASFHLCMALTKSMNARLGRFRRSARRLPTQSTAATISERCAASSTTGAARAHGTPCQHRNAAHLPHESTKSPSISGRRSTTPRAAPI